MPRKILFLVPYPLGESPSQRFRFEQYFSLLKEQGFELTTQSFLNSHNWQLFFKPGNGIGKIIALLSGFTRRWIILFQAPSFDFIFIHREATPIGPPLMEWLLAKVFGKKNIYDFDDAIWLTDRKHESIFLKIAKWRSKVGSICRWSYRVSCGNDYLLNYASGFNDMGKYMPTTIDTANWHNPDRFPTNNIKDQLVIGWTGSHSTLKYLSEIESILKQIELKYAHVRFVVIADRKPELALKSLQFIPWNKLTEIEDLMVLDIGIMPLPDDEWANGKCGFKALQYMALRIPTVVSPVGVNTKIVDHGINGFVASTPDEWLSSLTSLIENEKLRKEMGIAGRSKIISHYSVISTSSSFVSLFE